MEKEVSLINMDIHHFWIHLTKVLSTIFDTHGVCAAIANETAVFTKHTTILALCEPNGKYYDTWICHPNGQIKQARWYGENEFINDLLEDNDIRVAEKQEQSPHAILNSEMWKLPEENMLIIPFPYPRIGNYIIPDGFLSIVDHAEECQLNIYNLPNLSVLFTTFLERAVLRYQRDRQAIEFAITSDISQSLTSTLELNKIFHSVSDNIRRMLDVESLSLGLINKNSGKIVFIPELMGRMFLEFPVIELEPGDGIAGWVAQNKKPLIVNNVYEDTRWNKGSDEQSGFITRSILCVPLQEKNRVIGIMEAINKRNGEFTNHDKNLLEALSGPLTAAILNAELHEDVVSEKRRFEAMFESMSEGVITIGAESHITAVNDSMTTLIGQSEAELIGKKVTDVIKLKENDFSKFLREVGSFKRKNQLADNPQLACEILKGHTWIPVLASGAAVRTDDGEVDEAIVVFSDLRQIREVERMRDDFFHAIVHELRTPLATILMYARLLLKGKLEESERSTRFLKNIERESDRLQAMVRQMLQLAKLENKEIERSYSNVNVNEMLDEMIPALADSALEKGLIFVQRIDSDLPVLHANPDTIYLVIKNLIVNAIKFTLQGSVTIEAHTASEFVVVRVIDEGIGIPEQSLQNLFKRFYRAQTAVEKGIAGTGLGLYMVKEGVESHGGTINVESKEGEGTTFTVRIPYQK